MDIQIHESALKYLCGLDPKTQWKAHGRRGGHVDGDPEAAKLVSGEIELVKSRVNSGEYAQQLNDFAAEVHRLTTGLLAGDKKLREHYILSRKFIFICGIMRSGGACMYQEISSALGIDWRNLSYWITLDSIPSFGLLFNHYKPEVLPKVISEMAQFLVWASRETAGNEYVLQKRGGYGHSIPLLESLFGKSAEYFVTVRHPGSACASFSELVGVDENDPAAATPGGWRTIVELRNPQAPKWETLDYRRKYLWYWRTYYFDVVRSGMNADRIRPLIYGQASFDFIGDLAKQHKSGYTPTAFSPRKREYHPFWRSDEVEQVISEVAAFWKMFGLDFVEFDGIW